MGDAEPTTTEENRDTGAKFPVGILEQIIDATLSDARVTETVSVKGATALRKLLCAQGLAKPAEIIAAANEEEAPRETA